MPRNVLPIVALSIGSLSAAAPAVAQESINNIVGTSFIQSTNSSTGISNDDLLSIISGQSSSPTSVTGNISDYSNIFSGTSAPGSIPPDVWNIMQGQSANIGRYGNLLSTFEGLVSGRASIADLGSGIVFDDWSSGFVEGGLSGNRSLPMLGGVDQIPGLENIISDGQDRIPDIGDLIPSSRGSDAPAQQTSDSSGFLGGFFGNFKFPDLSNFNPFRSAVEFLKNTPLATFFGSLSQDIRGNVENNSLGIFTQNPVVKQRDQANLADQEVARMMASQRLGEKGTKWLTEEIEESTATLNVGLQSAAAAIETGTTAQALTSTQDVAKAVALQGGQNAALSASVLQAQMQNQDALLQLQQLTSSSIQLAADNSEGIDELNRRERVTRTRALYDSAEGFLYVPGVFEEED